jgi:transglutaminase-like putative cysteine protease
VNGRTRVALHGGVATLGAASALGAVFADFGWLWPVVGAVTIVVVAGELVRRSPLPAALGPLVAAAAVLCYLTWLYAGDTAVAGVVPTGSSLSALGDVARTGFTDVRKLAPPVPSHDGLVLLAVVGVASIALVVDLFAVTLRRAALAGLPLLAVFATGTSIAKHGAGWFPFTLAAIGYLWLLLADSRDRLARWGRSLGTDRDARPRFSWSDEEVAPSPLSVMGRRIGVAAVVAGVALPMLVPGLHGGVPHGGGSGLGLGDGDSRALTVNPIVTIAAQLAQGRAQPLLTVQTDDPDPGYLRLTSLDRFNGEEFSPSPLSAGTNAAVSRGIAAPAVAGPQIRTTVNVQNLQVRWLPLPVQVEQVQVDGDWRYDPPSNTVFSARTDTRGIQYSVVSVHPTPSASELENAGGADSTVQHYLDLPTLAPEVVDLTQRIIAGATTPFDKAVAIQQFFQSTKFTYDTSVQASDSTTALTDFLLHSHRGFCQQYASAMAIMARIADIPSRIAVGFTHGDRQPDGTWLITTRDAHAWPELYFAGYGWVPFEPTPRTDGQAVEPTYTQSAPGSHGGKGTTGKGTQGGGKKPPSGAPGSKNNQFDLNNNSAGGPVFAAPPAPVHHANIRSAVLLALLCLLLVLLVVPSISRVLTRRRRWQSADTPAEAAMAAWAELRASAIDARVGWIDGLTPRVTARLLRTEAGGLATAESRALDRIVTAVEHATYAADARGMRSDGLRDDVEDIRAALLGESTVGERFVLRAWPRSTLRGARESFARITEMLDRVDLAGARLRARLRHRPA